MATGTGNNSFAINDWRVDPPLNRISRADEVIKIDPQNMKVLELLASRPGEVISQSEIEQIAWSGVIVTPNSVYQSIAQLRRALGDDKANPKFIETIARKGYRLIATVAGCGVLTGTRQEHGSHDLGAPLFKRLSQHPRVRLATAASILLAIVVPAVLAHVQWLTSTPSVIPTPERVTGTVHYGADVESATARAERLGAMGDVALTAGHPREALRHFQEAMRAIDEFASETDPVRAEYLAKIAEVYHWSDDSGNAMRVAREALSILETSAPDMHPSFVDVRRTLGHALIDEEKYADAEVHLVAALELSRTLYGDLDVDTLSTKNALVSLRVAQHRWESAADLAAEVLQQHQDMRGAAEETAFYRGRLARILYAKGEYKRALEEANSALEMLERTTRPDHQFVGSAQQVVADALARTGDYRKAELVSRACLEIWKKNDSEPWRSARAASTLGEALLKQGKLAEAEQYLGYAARILEGQRGYLQKEARRENERRLSDLSVAKQTAASST